MQWAGLFTYKLKNAKYTSIFLKNLYLLTKCSPIIRASDTATN